MQSFLVKSKRRKKKNNMKKIQTLTISAKSRQDFVLKKGEKYYIAPFKYTNPSNPMADSVFKPLDSSRVKISTESLSDSEKVTVENDLDFGINIEIYQP